jgi:hypothetical protein
MRIRLFIFAEQIIFCIILCKVYDIFTHYFYPFFNVHIFEYI